MARARKRVIRLFPGSQWEKGEAIQLACMLVDAGLAVQSLDETIAEVAGARPLKPSDFKKKEELAIVYGADAGMFDLLREFPFSVLVVPLLRKGQRIPKLLLPMLLPGEGDVLSLGALGEWRIAPPERVLEMVMGSLVNNDFKGKTVLITAGPTVEDVDPVRFISNRSTGKMGTAIARMAARRGAEVILIHGPMSAPIPPSGMVHPFAVRSARQMHDLVMKSLPDCDVAILSAAVADFEPLEFTEFKIKKGDSDIFDLKMRRTPDILASVGALPKHPFLVGFAAETDHIRRNAEAKLYGKHCDLLCANDISAANTGFASPTNALTVYGKDGGSVELPLASKETIANQLLDIIAGKLHQK